MRLLYKINIHYLSFIIFIISIQIPTKAQNSRLIQEFEKRGQKHIQLNLDSFYIKKCNKSSSSQSDNYFIKTQLPNEFIKKGEIPPVVFFNFKNIDTIKINEKTYLATWKDQVQLVLTKKQNSFRWYKKTLNTNKGKNFICENELIDPLLDNYEMGFIDFFTNSNIADKEMTIKTVTCSNHHLTSAITFKIKKEQDQYLIKCTYQYPKSKSNKWIVLNFDNFEKLTSFEKEFIVSMENFEKLEDNYQSISFEFNNHFQHFIRNETNRELQNFLMSLFP